MHRTSKMFATLAFLAVIMGMAQNVRADDLTIGQPHTAQAMTYCDNAEDAKTIAQVYVEGGMEEGRKKLVELALGKNTCSRTAGHFTPEEQVATFTKGDTTIHVIRITDMSGGGTWFALTQHNVVKANAIKYKVEQNT